MLTGGGVSDTVALPELVPGMVLGCGGWVGTKAPSGEEKRTDLPVCFLVWVVCEEDPFLFWMS